MRVYVDQRLNQLFIEGVSSGPVVDYAITHDGDLVSIYRSSLQVYDIYNWPYTKLQSRNGNGFPNVNACMDYLTNLTLYQSAITAVYPLQLDNNTNYLSIDKVDLTDGGNF